MKTTAITATLLSFVAVIQAADLIFCHDHKFGDCETLSVPQGNCWNVPKHLNDKISSVDTFNIVCTFFQHAGCTGDSWRTRGRTDGMPKGWNDKISSAWCD